MADKTEKKQTIGKVVVLGGRLSFESLYEPNRQKDDDGNVRENWKATSVPPCGSPKRPRRATSTHTSCASTGLMLRTLVQSATT